MFSIVISPLAKDDISEISKYYNQSSFGLGKQFTKRIREKMLLVKKHPYAAPILFGDVHVIPIKQFPYVIYYKIKNRFKYNFNPCGTSYKP